VDGSFLTNFGPVRRSLALGEGVLSIARLATLAGGVAGKKEKFRGGYSPGLCVSFSLVRGGGEDLGKT